MILNQTTLLSREHLAESGELFGYCEDKESRWSIKSKDAAEHLRVDDKTTAGNKALSAPKC
jgi:hypothetical protein